MCPWRSDNHHDTLANLKPGCHAAVVEVFENSGLKIRLMEMGFVPGMSVEVLCGDEDLLIRLGENRLCLRKESADWVSVMPMI